MRKNTPKIIALVLSAGLIAPVVGHAVSGDTSEGAAVNPLQILKGHLEPLYDKPKTSADAQIGMGFWESLILANRFRIVVKKVRINGAVNGLMAEETALLNSVEGNTRLQAQLFSELDTNSLLRSADSPVTLQGRIDHLNGLIEANTGQAESLRAQAVDNSTRLASETVGASEGAASEVTDKIKTFQADQARIGQQIAALEQESAAYARQIESLSELQVKLREAGGGLPAEQRAALQTEAKALEQRIGVVSEELGAAKSKLADAQTKLANAVKRQVKVSPKPGITRGFFRWGMRLGELLIAVDLAGRVYVWNVLDKDPGFSPLAHYVANTGMLGSASESLKRFLAEVEAGDSEGALQSLSNETGAPIQDISDVGAAKPE
ncbi:MAG: hypothetical protein H6624_00015 [Bdellovibrionaceae bacterium]|nr:hypothetical protein [Bdellovibrionales bacterium]MCB9082690.1 hypothetical protein [Pseudobdellovibrionaceae bacterium]